jgi:hypothetical protein
LNRKTLLSRRECPSLAREVTRTWDRRFRLSSVLSGADVGESWWLDSADRRGVATRPNDVIDYFFYDANDRLVALNSWYISSTNPAIQYIRSGKAYGYDAWGNRTHKQEWPLSDRSEHYGYDNRDRLTGMDRGVLDANGQVPAGDILAHPTRAGQQQWSDLDRRGNWKDYRETVNAVSARRIADVNPANGYTCVAANAAVNAQQCTTQPPVTLTYDPAGNLKFDLLARVVGHQRPGGVEFLRRGAQS